MLKRYCLRILLLGLASTQIPGPLRLLAQQARSEGNRKMVVEIRPVYPPLARKMRISGIVRLRITVSPAGYPIDTLQLGGSPVLVKAATQAVSGAKWEAMPAESKEIIQIKFDANHK